MKLILSSIVSYVNRCKETEKLLKFCSIWMLLSAYHKGPIAKDTFWLQAHKEVKLERTRNFLLASFCHNTGEEEPTDISSCRACMLQCWPARKDRPTEAMMAWLLQGPPTAFHWNHGLFYRKEFMPITINPLKRPWLTSSWPLEG